ncbi:M23 family metallopeptidase [Pseudoflavonifractor intestinihominis]|uniref:M23 family metallopeptidase n=1 Tax=Pseudoflavonifractor intestinihominis TaxID=3133171 RepID=A0ABV1EAU3_9FIRM|nr:M23 family metallopeptidase [uncultured Pseudoflavonifractor sp.]
MDEILHSNGRQAVPDAIPAEETAGGVREEGSSRQGRRPVLDALIAAGRSVGALLHRADAAAAGHKAVGPLAFLLIAGVIGVALVVGTVYTPSYVVSVDGVTLGVVSDPEVFEGAMERVEARASDILGYDYTLDNAVTYDFALTEKDKLSNVGDFETYLFDQIGEVMKSYVLKVNGQFIGAAQDETSLTAMLDAIKAPYVNENTTSAEFVESVSISRQYTPSDVEQDLSAMEARLTANTNGQTTYEVQKGDTFMQIAYDNDMSLSELEALNPDVDINNIYIGQILNVREVIPFLSVQTTETITYQEAIASPVEEVEDDSMYQGDTKVLDAGSEGLAEITADVTYVNGNERERNITNNVTITEPTAKVIAVGTKERPSWLPTGSFIWPVYGNITSYFGYRYIFGSYSYHSGIDIAAAYGTGIQAADGGTVIWAGTGTGSNWSYGKYVIIDHGNGYQTYYAHCSSLLVSVGDKVYQGQVIARVGSTGRSTGNHCHFQVKINGTTVNPLSYLP